MASTTNIIDSVVKEVSDIMSTRLSRVCADYALYKESHDAILAIPAVQRAIRDGPRFKQEPRDEEDEKEKETITINQQHSHQLTQCFALIESLQTELQMVKLENDALRLQLQREPQMETRIDSPPSENITLVIEETESSTRVDDVEVQNEEADQNEQDDQAEEEEEDEEEDQDTVYEEEEQGEQNDGNEEEADEGEGEDQNTVEEEEEQEEQEEQDDQPDNEEEGEQPDSEEEEEEEEEVEEPVQEEEEVEVVEVEIKGKMYFTTNETSGIIYECLADGDIGDEIGKFVKGKPVFNTKTK